MNKNWRDWLYKIGGALTAVGVFMLISVLVVCPTIWSEIKLGLLFFALGVISIGLVLIVISKAFRKGER